MSSVRLCRRYEGRFAFVLAGAAYPVRSCQGGYIEAGSAAVEPDAADEAANCVWLVAVLDAPSSLDHLGIGYAKGPQGERNPRLAMRFFLRAAMQSYTPAMAHPGALYQMGAWGRPNFPRAYPWVRAALSFGVPVQDHDATVMKLGMIAARLTPTDIEHSEELAETIAARILKPYNCSPGRETALALKTDALSHELAEGGENQ